MLLRQEPEAVIAIGQASHAWVSGQLARAWGNERFAAPEPREEVCLGAEQHDVGMAEWDLHPELNSSTGLPRSFLELPLATHLELWTAAAAKLITQSRYAALLVSLHGSALNERREPAKLEAREQQLVRSFLDGQRTLQKALAERLGADPGQLRRNQRLLWTWDSLSLALCLRWQAYSLAAVPTGGPSELKLDLAFTAGADRFTLDPWPFAADRVEVRCEGSLLKGRFSADAALHEALERAPVIELSFTLEPS